MRPNAVPTPADGESDLFRNRLDNVIDNRHEFVRLSGLIDWKRFDEAFGALYAQRGRPGLPTRLMVGLHPIKHARGPSDEQVCAQWRIIHTLTHVSLPAVSKNRTPLSGFTKTVANQTLPSMGVTC